MDSGSFEIEESARVVELSIGREGDEDEVEGSTDRRERTFALSETQQSCLRLDSTLQVDDLPQLRTASSIEQRRQREQVLRPRLNDSRT